MDINTLRVILLVLCFMAFIGIIWWAYGGSRKNRFEEAAHLPFNEENLISDTKPDPHLTSPHKHSKHNPVKSNRARIRTLKNRLLKNRLLKNQES